MRVLRSVLMAAACLLGAGLAAGCSPTRQGGPPRPVASTPATTAPAPTTTTTAPPPPTTTWAPTAAQATPDAAAARLIDQWSTGDRAGAASVAAPAAVQTLFALPYPAGWVQPRGCTAASTNPGTCTYRNTETNAIYEITVNRAATGWYVSAVTPES